MTTTLEDKNTRLHSDEAHLRQLILTATIKPQMKTRANKSWSDVWCRNIFDKLTVQNVKNTRYIHWTQHMKALAYLCTLCMHLIKGSGGGRWKIRRDTALFLLFANPIRCAVSWFGLRWGAAGGEGQLGRVRTRREVSKTGFFWSQSEE